MTNWFEELFGFREESPFQVRANLELRQGSLISKVNGRSCRTGNFITPSLESLRFSVNTGQGIPVTLEEVVADAKALHADPASNGAVFQVASQFNTLEMVSPERIPEEGVGIYDFDRTQGPACAIACGAGTVFRNYFVPLHGQIGQSVHRQIDCLAEVGESLGNQGNILWSMQNGYLMTTSNALQQVCHRISALSPQEYEALKGKLRVGLQEDTEVTHQSSGNIVTQVYCSALPVAYNSLPAKMWEPFARMILEATYEATFWIALQNLKRNGNPVLFLTLVGGGAFGNQEDWIQDAILMNLVRFKDSGLKVKFVSYGKPSATVGTIMSGFNHH